MSVREGGSFTSFARAVPGAQSAAAEMAMAIVVGWAVRNIPRVLPCVQVATCASTKRVGLLPLVTSMSSMPRSRNSCGRFAFSPLRISRDLINNGLDASWAMTSDCEMRCGAISPQPLGVMQARLARASFTTANNVSRPRTDGAGALYANRLPHDYRRRR